jgi:hypothetical protein
MSRSISKRAALTGLAVAGVLSVGIAAPVAAYAADRDGRPAAGSRGNGSPGDGKDRAAALAKELGIPEDQVTDALSKVREQLRPEGGPGNGHGHGPRGGQPPSSPESPAPTPTK